MNSAAKTGGIVSRRGLLGVSAATAAAGAAAATGVARAINNEPEPAPPAGEAPDAPIPFHGLHQAGIANPAPGHLLLTAYDTTSRIHRAELAEILQAWTAAARDLTAGRPTTDHTMIGAGAGAAALTITVGVGRTLLMRLKIDTPAALADLPAFAGDELETRRSNGDIVVQICADDPLVVASADRVLRRLAGRALTVRWQTSGFQGKANHTDANNGRNLMGQIDGTNNVSTSPLAHSGPIWVDAAEPRWMTGGSYLVVRRIRMLLDSWEDQSLDAQERVIGRHKASGAPLGSKNESDPVDLQAKGSDGLPLIPTHSHVRLATPGKGEEMSRRGYSYRDGILPDGSTDQGLLFLAYVKDPTTSFVPVQRRLAAHDALGTFTRTTGSALFAILPGVTDDDDWIGKSLLG